MSGLFSLCYSLKDLPDISEWDTSNAINMSKMFNYCTSLEELPDISKWNTSKVINMRKMFCQCLSLSHFPELLYGNFNNTNIHGMFYNCENIPYLKENEKENKLNLILEIFSE